MSTFITELDVGGDPDSGGGLRLAVKDAIDVAGVVTTVGSAVLAERHGPAATDAACLAGARAAGARIVGKANLHELCFGGTGVNPWFGTPVNPLDPRRIPGGSSSGSAVAVATGQADVAYGTDTAGSIRNPSACCGTVGLKTTWGSLPLEGIWPLSPFLDTVGPMARDVAGVAAGLALLDPGFTPLGPDRLGPDRLGPDRPGPGSLRVGRFRGLGEVDPVIDAAIDQALEAAGLTVEDVALPGWDRAGDAGITILLGEALEVDRAVWEQFGRRLGADIQTRFAFAEALPAGALARARDVRPGWRSELAGAFAAVDVIALPAMPWFAPFLGEEENRANPAAVPVNLAGHPAIALPVPTRHAAGSADAGMLASLQLIAPDHHEPRLLALAAHIEAAVA